MEPVGNCVCPVRVLHQRVHGSLDVLSAEPEQKIVHVDSGSKYVGLSTIPKPAILQKIIHLSSLWLSSKRKNAECGGPDIKVQSRL